MALSKVPIASQWHILSGCTCTPDGGFLYVGHKAINYIGNAHDEAPLIKAFHTRQNITSVDVDPGWLDGHKFFALLAQDSSVQIWDFEKGCAVSGHKAHCGMPFTEGQGPAPHYIHEQVLLSYMRNRNVLTMDVHCMIVYCVASNTYCRRTMFPLSRNTRLTILSCSPYNEHIFAVGTSRGLVLVCDLQQNKILYTLRGHDEAITSLSWTSIEAPVEMKDTTPPTTTPIPNTLSAKRKNSLPKKDIAATGDDIFDIYDYDYLENEFGTPVNNPASKVDVDGDFVGIEKPKEASISTKFDYVEACQSLKEDIDALKQDTLPSPTQCDAVTLADCQQVKREDDLSSSCGSDSGKDHDSTEGSLEVIEHHSGSSDGVDIDGAEHKPKQEILHQAEVHATQTLERKLDDQKLANEDKKPEKVENLHKNDSPSKESRNRGDVLLVSASANGAFWIWNADVGAACDSFKLSLASRTKPHFAVAWLNGTTFLAINGLNTLACWKIRTDDVNASKQAAHLRRYKFKEEKRHKEAQRSLVAFSLCRNTQTVWCVTSYRDIICEDIATGQLLAKYSCASTNIVAMRECPDDMNKIALAFSDRRIGILDISKMSAKSLFIENFALRIDSSVLSMAWSPDNKRLAYGTLEGLLGIVNVENPKLEPYTLNPVCGKHIYSIAWQGANIFIVCNDKIAVYDVSGNNKDGDFIPNMRGGFSTVSVRGNYLFAGTRRGHVQVYRRKSPTHIDFELVQDIECATHYITEITWSPIDLQQCAVIANSKHIQVLSFNDNADAATELLTNIRKIVIKNSKAANACVKWSNRNKFEFLTCGFDGAVRVWDLRNEKDEEKFLKQFHCPMLCGLFLPTDENFIMCAGKSTSVEIFDMRVEKSEDYSMAKWNHANTHVLDNVKWALKAPTRNETKSKSAAEKRRNKQHAATAANNAIRVDVNSVDNGNTDAIATASVPDKHINGNAETSVEIVELINELKINESTAQTPTKSDLTESTMQKSFMKKPATLLYLITKELNKEALQILATVLTTRHAEAAHEAALCLKLFGTKTQAHEVLTQELNNHKQSDTHSISSVFMPQINASIKDEIISCIKLKQLTEWHVSVAPTISYSFWQKCAQAFADQLIEQGYILHAATYMLALHHQRDTITMLMEEKYFKESLLIARIYLQRDDPLINAIIDKWIAQLDSNGNLPAAALLCALNEQMNRAYEILIKLRNTDEHIERVLKLLKEHKQFK